MPQAPYTGGPNLVAPLLPAIPDSRGFSETLGSTDEAVWNDSVAQSLDLWSLSFGGELIYQKGHKYFFMLGAGIVGNIANWDSGRSDVLYQSINGAPSVAVDFARTSRSGTDFLFGVYAEAALGYQVTESFSVETTLRYDWNENLSRSTFDVDLSGYSVGVGARFSF
jgi:hypothetical protein